MRSLTCSRGADEACRKDEFPRRRAASVVASLRSRAQGWSAPQITLCARSWAAVDYLQSEGSPDGGIPHEREMWRLRNVTRFTLGDVQPW